MGQQRRFRSLVELSRYYHLLVKCDVGAVIGRAADFMHGAASAPSWHNESRWDLLQSFPCLFEVNCSAALALQCLHESEEVADKRIGVGLFESFTFLVHSVGNHSEVGLYVWTVRFEQALVDVRQLLSHSFVFGILSGGRQSSLCFVLVCGCFIEDVFLECKSGFPLHRCLPLISCLRALVLKFEFLKFC